MPLIQIVVGNTNSGGVHVKTDISDIPKRELDWTLKHFCASTRLVTASVEIPIFQSQLGNNVLCYRSSRASPLAERVNKIVVLPRFCDNTTDRFITNCQLNIYLGRMQMNTNLLETIFTTYSETGAENSNLVFSYILLLEYK